MIRITIEDRDIVAYHDVGGRIHVTVSYRQFARFNDIIQTSVPFWQVARLFGTDVRDTL